MGPATYAARVAAWFKQQTPADQREFRALLQLHISLYEHQHRRPSPPEHQDARRAALLKDTMLRKQVRARDQDRCRYCGVPVDWEDRRGEFGATYDHVNPYGENTFDNVVVACHPCNIRKSMRSPDDAEMPLLSAPVSTSDLPPRVKSELTPGVKSTRPPPAPPSLLDPALTRPVFPEELKEIPEVLRQLKAPAELDDAMFWIRIDGWLGGEHSGVAYLDELPKYLAWVSAQNGSRTPKNFRRGFRNWLAKSEYWSQQRAQTEAHRQARR